MSLYKATEYYLYNYKTMKAEVKNIDLEIDQMEYMGCAGVSYEEKSAPTNQFNSSVENEVIIREKRIASLEQSKRDTLIKINKIDNALETLEPRDLDIIKLRYFDKLNNRIIAIRLELSEEWICTLKALAVNKLSTLINIK
ncbi:RNA polymerase subunit sigma [Clostridium estertheticum]|uniref:sigma factor-like helix-turn-helix DNA-binding protein n=1 Tax=Clostridium estertheticum TaxID=238834 RepID=UPI001CF104E9|nr:sigma factor-like helix-turn-helix DNA-binding protein [Clostridium estertheticum]MCB2308838.1 RNA polymerase subunit sigma [Clostridium estertheticum]MCB2347326.1 RNA polymerase subunit sigma [Clostridium estertheticum]MCB2351908.1 RNA polymerase subunit sigma [Clostridium estertheticum]WAG48524.1 RNA polymerase subunit sigma [Clostridium estertheticum]